MARANAAGQATPMSIWRGAGVFDALRRSIAGLNGAPAAKEAFGSAIHGRG